MSLIEFSYSCGINAGSQTGPCSESTAGSAGSKTRAGSRVGIAGSEFSKDNEGGEVSPGSLVDAGSESAEGSDISCASAFPFLPDTLKFERHLIHFQQTKNNGRSFTNGLRNETLH